MRVFLTGATGFIGSHILPELLDAGHQVLGLTRSDEGARQLEQAGATPIRGNLNEPTSVAQGAEQADAVIHCAFDHDFQNFLANIEKDSRVIGAIGNVLAGTDRPFIITSGVGMGSNGDGQPAREKITNWNNPNPRIASERAGADARAQGASVATVRLPQVHDTQKQGLITPLIAIAQAKGAVPILGDGSNRWAAAHVSDVARLYRLALDQHQSGAVYNAVGEMGVAARDIANILSTNLGIPVASLDASEAAEFFGSVDASWFAPFIGMDLTASNDLTRKLLDWEPTGPGLLADLRAMAPAST